MENPTSRQVIEAAEAEFRREQFREAVDAYKQQLRNRPKQTLWQRLVSKLPFTITIKRKI
jgi:hypothetical protein